MAVEVNWTDVDIGSLVAATPADLVKYPSQTRYFASGHASDWCKHYVPSYVKAVRVRNLGTGTLYVSLGPALSGSAASAATANAEAIPAGESVLYALEGDPPTREKYTTFSTYGADGASHAMCLVFEARP